MILTFTFSSAKLLDLPEFRRRPSVVVVLLVLVTELAIFSDNSFTCFFSESLSCSSSSAFRRNTAASYLKLIL